MKTVYGHTVRNLQSAVIVSSKVAKELLAKAIESDARRAKYGFKPVVHPDLAAKFNSTKGDQS